MISINSMGNVIPNLATHSIATHYRVIWSQWFTALLAQNNKMMTPDSAAFVEIHYLVLKQWQNYVKKPWH